MFSNNYYSLVAGLRTWALESDTKGFDLKSILSDIEEGVSKKDWKAVKLLYTYYDVENLVSRFSGSESFNPLGWMTRDEVAQALREPAILPDWLSGVVIAYTSEAQDEDVDTSLPFSKALFGAYLGECMRSSSAFLREWIETDFTIRNIVAATVAREKHLAVSSLTVGDSDTVRQIESSQQQDFGLRAELPWIEGLLAAVSEEKDMVSKERRIDRIRWDLVDERSQFSYFNMDAILAYLVHCNLVARWMVLDEKTGREMFRRMVDSFSAKEKIKNTLNR